MLTFVDGTVSLFTENPSVRATTRRYQQDSRPDLQQAHIVDGSLNACDEVPRRDESTLPGVHE
jgi:hypothetical protein